MPEQSEQARRLKEATKNLPRVVPGGGTIELVEAPPNPWTGQDGQVQARLVPSPGASARALRRAADLLARWERALQSVQGPTTGRDAFLEVLSVYQERGHYSYARIARDLNAAIERRVRQWWEQFDADLQTAAARLRVDADHLQHAAEVPPSLRGVLSVHHALRSLGVPEKDIETITRDALERLAEGQQVFPRDHPVDAARVKQALRTWRKGQRHRKVYAEWRAREAPPAVTGSATGGPANARQRPPKPTATPEASSQAKLAQRRV
jgi:hypothetical protein